jgi:hypothetical protein
MTVSVSASVEYDSPARVLVDVASSPSVTGPLKLWRVHEDGTRHRVLTSGRAVVVGGWTGYDYHAPFNQDFSYVASVEGQADSAASAAQYIMSAITWLVHPADPELSVPLDVVVKFGSLRRPSTSAKFKILGSSQPVIRTDSPRGPLAGDITVLANDDTEAQALDALFADSGPILLNCHRPEIVRWLWIAPGDTTMEPPGGYYRTPYRQLSFPWEECRAPDADVQPVWDLAGLAAAGFADLAVVNAQYDDLRALQLDLRTP